MGMAFMLAAGSPKGTQAGAVIVNHFDRPLGVGFDQPPAHLNDPAFTRHAEKVALSNCRGDPSSGILYVTHVPCFNCLMDIADAGIKRVVYFHGTYDKEAQDFAHQSYVRLEKFKGTLGWTRDRILTMQELGVFE